MLDDLDGSAFVSFAVTMLVALMLVTISLGVFSVLSVSGSTSINATTTGYTPVDAALRDVPNHVTVEATTGYGLSFSGDQALSASLPSNLTNNSWTVCAAVELNDTSNQNGTYDVVAYDNASILLQFDDGQWSVYANNGSADGKATIAAPDPTTTTTGGGYFSWLFPSKAASLRRVCGRYDAASNELVVARDGNVSAAVPLTASTTTRNVSVNWTGREDEIRVFGSAVSNATLAEYSDDPVQPLPGTNRIARLMLDEGSGTTTKVYFATQTIPIGNASWADGAQRPSLSLGTDYQLHNTPFSLRVLPGGYLEGAPVEYVSWTGGGNIPSWFRAGIGPLLFVGLVYAISEGIERFG